MLKFKFEEEKKGFNENEENLERDLKFFKLENEELKKFKEKTVMDNKNMVIRLEKQEKLIKTLLEENANNKSLLDEIMKENKKIIKMENKNLFDIDEKPGKISKLEQILKRHSSFKKRNSSFLANSFSFDFKMGDSENFDINQNSYYFSSSIYKFY